MAKKIALLDEEQVDRLVDVWFVAVEATNGESLEDEDVELLEKFESMRLGRDE